MADFVVRITKIRNAESISTEERTIELGSTESDYLRQIAAVDVSARIAAGQNAFDNWATLTNPQKDAVLKAMLGDMIHVIKVLSIIPRWFL